MVNNIKISKDNPSKQKKASELKRLGKIIALIYLTIIFIVFLIILESQKKIFFHPWNDTSSYNQLKNISDFEEINIISDDKNLNGWMYYNNPRGEKSPLVIYFGGNAENSSNAMSYFLDSGIFDYFEGYNVLMMDYPEYGYSEGTIEEEVLFKVAMDIYEWAASQLDVDENNIVIMGYSIGTGIATYCASKNNIKGLILIAPYDRAMSLYNNAINIFHGPLKLLAKYKFDSLSYAKDIDVNVQVITSYDDEVISYKFSQNLSNNFKNHNDIVILDKNVRHSDYFGQTKVLDTIKTYLSEIQYN